MPSLIFLSFVSPLLLFLASLPVPGLCGKDNEAARTPSDTGSLFSNLPSIDLSAAPIATRTRGNSRILLRQETATPFTSECPSNERTLCPFGYPEPFCCLKTESCFLLAGKSTALCCPNGSSCEQIQPLPCDINLYISTKSKIVTTAIDQTLPGCGADAEGSQTCCPFGYSCFNGTRCVKDKDQSRYPGVALPVSTQPASAAQSPSAGSAGTTIAATASTTAPANPGSNAPTSSRNVGVIVGSTIAVVTFMAVLLLVAWLQRTRLRRQALLFRERISPMSERVKGMTSLLSARVRDTISLLSARITGSSTIRPSGDDFPSPPPYDYHQQHHHYFKLEECARVPRRKTVGRLNFAATFAPVELPATPVSESIWAAQRNFVVPQHSARRSRASIFSFTPSPVALSRPPPSQQFDPLLEPLPPLPPPTPRIFIRQSTIGRF